MAELYPVKSVADTDIFAVVRELLVVSHNGDLCLFGQP